MNIAKWSQSESHEINRGIFQEVRDRLSDLAFARGSRRIPPSNREEVVFLNIEVLNGRILIFATYIDEFSREK